MKTIWEYNRETGQVEPNEMTFEEVYEQYQPLINLVIKKWWSYEDIKQIAEIHLWRVYETYDCSKQISFSHYAQKMITYRLIRHHRNNMSPRVKPSENILSLDYVDNDGKSIMEALQSHVNLEERISLKDEMKRVIDQLNDREKITLHMFCEGYKQREIADVLNTSQVNISRMITRIRNRFNKEDKAC